MRLYARADRAPRASRGRFTVRDWFWERIPACATPASFVATMGLGFESANLEHTASFAARFREAGDEEGARVQELVGREEIAHVRFGARWFDGVHRRARLRDAGARRCPRLSRRCSCAAVRSSARRACARVLRRLSRRARRMAAGVAWVLNLDADLELGAGAAVAQPTRTSVRARHEGSTSQRLARIAARPGRPPRRRAQRRRRRARAASGARSARRPRALASSRRAGADPEPHPPVDVLRRVNSRAFAACARARRSPAPRS